ncbi:type II toxin-antitoxin system RelE/ParE family toxin [Sulfurimonas sp. SWIR-19]|uniref:type II toxin-antitoxin system RelE family toxin n=1 Tax=Sulfurimonas sp. SWIR-19 TaxID=2878390 RepID=UPI001CF2170E|nr:type II toxin-antitoxin system RelE/ParE family toxin [Sulfurimonas sp. SWIR-19]UCN00217.1 type II toxin-antitoxin system RelE/ParE family toxin [Sulfurimonas sp. SWIR-19]
MSLYRLQFTKNAKKEWDKLDHSIQLQLHKKLKQRLQNPKVPSAKLSGFDNVYKIKLRNSGYRLAYEVKDVEIIVIVLKIGKRENFYELLRDFLK